MNFLEDSDNNWSWSNQCPKLDLNSHQEIVSYFFPLKIPEVLVMNAYLEPKYKPINDSSKPRLRELVKSTHLNHLMLVCDGNRRWARGMGYHPSDGHRRSFGYLMENLVSDLIDLDIHTITMYCASTYNMMNRDKEELSIGMGIIEVMIRNITPIAMSNNVRFIHLGRKDRITRTLLLSVRSCFDLI